MNKHRPSELEHYCLLHRLRLTLNRYHACEVLLEAGDYIIAVHQHHYADILFVGIFAFGTVGRTIY